MEGEENILDSINEEENLELYDDDVEMVDVEEGELVEDDSRNVLGQNGAASEDTNETDNKKQKPQSKNRRRRANKRKRKGSGSDAIDINRFTLFLILFQSFFFIFFQFFSSSFFFFVYRVLSVMSNIKLFMRL